MSNAGNNLPPTPFSPKAVEYSLPQSVFMCSLGSNALFGQYGSPQTLLDNICKFLVGSAPFPPPAPPAEWTPASRPSSGGLFFQTLNQAEEGYSWLKGGDWTVVWGPQVFAVGVTVEGKSLQGASNTMYVAYSKSNNTYVVAIAGTNPAGLVGAWEDLLVQPSQMMAFPPGTKPYSPPIPTPLGPLPTTTLSWTYATPGKSFDASTVAAIDGGTAQGLTILYDMCDPWTGQTVVEFLNSVGQQGQTLVFTGHSLGGALSPSFAMLLYPQAAVVAAGNAANPSPTTPAWSNVYIVATAGPTPGTPAFANMFVSPVPPVNVPAQFQPTPISTPTLPVPGVSYSGPYAPVPSGTAAPAALQANGAMPMPYWNVNYANVYDIVPHAWTLLASVVQPPATGASSLESFFANGANLNYGTRDVDKLDAGTLANFYVTNAQSMVQYGQNPAPANQTPYYAQCLAHYVINGTWGYWTANSNNSYPSSYSAMAQTPATIALFFGTGTPSAAALVPWVLNAHLDQYSYSLLGFPAVQMPVSS